MGSGIKAIIRGWSLLLRGKLSLGEAIPVVVVTFIVVGLPIIVFLLTH